MARFYLKKLGRQELGVRPDGSIARGRYVYISKACESFFPHLSRTVTNDNILIPLIPPFSDDKVYTSYVYHNDKYNTAGGTRDEYRLYLNRAIDPERGFYKPADIIIFEKIETEGIIPQYILYLSRPGETHYSEFDNLIELSEINGGHALIPGELPFLQHRDINTDETAVIIAPEVRSEIIEQQQEALQAEQADIEDIRGASLFGPDSFRDFVLLAYNYRCAITGNAIRYKKLSNLEAAHIQPRAHAGTFLPCNGIALSRDMHWAFDKGMISINDDYTIAVHENLSNSPLMEFSGKRILLPAEPYFQPEKKFLKHHRENIFGMFLHSGSIRVLKTDR